MADALNGPPQIAVNWTILRIPTVYVAANLSEREHMQNQQNGTEPKALRPSPLPVDMSPNPKFVLMTLGLLGLALDLFVRPISLTDLALIVLAAAPWILEAWTLSVSRRTLGTLARAHIEAPVKGSTRAGIQEQRNDRSGQQIGVSRPERPSQPGGENIKKVQPAQPAARQLPREAGGSEPERRPVSPRNPEIRTSPPRTA